MGYGNIQRVKDIINDHPLGWRTLKSFGAKLDGSDDSVAVQAAVNSGEPIWLHHVPSRIGIATPIQLPTSGPIVMAGVGHAFTGFQAIGSISNPLPAMFYTNGSVVTRESCLSGFGCLGNKVTQRIFDIAYASDWEMSSINMRDFTISALRGQGPMSLMRLHDMYIRCYIGDYATPDLLPPFGLEMGNSWVDSILCNINMCGMIAAGIVEYPGTGNHAYHAVHVFGQPANGKSESNPAIPSLGDISGASGNKFYICVDGDPTPRLVTLSLANCTSGPNTAAEMQGKIQAIGTIEGYAYSTVTATFVASSGGYGYYTVKSGSSSLDNPASGVIITPGSPDVSSTLQLGVANNGLEIPAYKWYPRHYAVLGRARAKEEKFSITDRNRQFKFIFTTI